MDITVIFLICGIVLVLFLILLTFATRYRKCPSDKVKIGRAHV